VPEPDSQEPNDIRPLHELDLREEGDLTDFISRLWRSGKSAKRTHENRWAEHLAHMAGDQWLYYDPKEGRTGYGRVEEDVPHRVYLAVNVVQGFVEARVARLTQGNITWNSIPSTNDDDDRDRSEHHSRVLKFLWHDLGMDSKWVEAMFWVTVCHDCFLQSGWDADAGSGIAMGAAEADGPPAADSPVGQLATQFSVNTQQPGWANQLKVFEGANAADVVSPFEIIPDPDAESLEQCRFVLRSRRRSLTDLLERYPQHAEAIKNLSRQGPEEEHDLYPHIYFEGSGLGEIAEESASGLGQPVIVHELWHEPTETYPDGIRAVVCHSLVLYSGPNPYKQLPFVHLQEVPCPGCFWGTGAFRQADQVQSAINALVSQQVEIMEITCWPQTTAEESAGLRLDTWIAEPGAVNIVTNLNGIKREDAPQLPAYVDKLLQFYFESLERIFGEYDVSRGQPSAQASSGRAISLLHEANERRIGPILKRLQGALAEFGTQQLRVAAENWDQQRTIWAVGEGGERDYKTVAGGDLLGPDAGTGGLVPFDIQVTISRQRSVALVMEQLEFAIQHGILDPREHRQEMLEALHFEGATRGPWDLAAADRSKASDENEALLQGTPVETTLGDEDEEHVKTHQRAMLTTEFDRAVAGNPMVRDGFRWHVALHLRQQATKAVMPEILMRQVEAELMAQAGFTPAADDGAPGKAGEKQPTQSSRERVAPGPQ
jgi:hypothetical protein